MLELTDVVTTYGAVHALDGVSLSVPDGTILAVLGANGAGKTTLLRSINGLVRARSGSISYGGHDLLPHQGRGRRHPRDRARAGGPRA